MTDQATPAPRPSTGAPVPGRGRLGSGPAVASRVLTMPGAPLAFHVMAKPTGAVCNLDCGYCFFLAKEMLYPGNRFRMAADLHTLIRYCRDCDVRAICNGGCPKDRFAASPYGEPGQHYLCPGYKAFFGHTAAPMQKTAALLSSGDAPADLMAAHAAGDAQRGRNEPCSCDSGRKWKRCHGTGPPR